MTHFITFVLAFVTIALGGVYGGITYQTTFVNTTYEGYHKYDCVDFYEQPAFSHSSLKHLIPKERQNFKNSTKVKFNGKEGCPSGMVPIAPSREGEDPPPHLVPAQVHCSAVVRTKLGDGNRIFYGTRAIEGNYKPSVQGGGQWSASRFKLSSGSETIVAGWMVNPDYFKDNEAHLYISVTVSDGQIPDINPEVFVQKSRSIPLGHIPNRYSEVHGTQYGWDLTIVMNKPDGSWHLFIATVGGGKEEIGYWPWTLFQELNKGAKQIEWGGEINDPGAANPAPQMGSGEIVGENERSAGSFWQITAIDDKSIFVEPTDTEEFEDCSKLYTVVDKGNLGNPEFRSIFYGGRQTYE